MNYQFTRRFALLLLFLLAGGILFSSFHHHEGGKIFDECPVCRFQDSGTITSNFEISSHNLFLPAERNEALVENEVVYISHYYTLSTLPNAPPAGS